LKNRWEAIKDRWVSAFRNRETVPGFSLMQKVDAEHEWCAEAYMDTDYSTLDVETITTDQSDPTDVLSALKDHVVCLCMLIDDGSNIVEISLIDADESVILGRFWQLAHSDDLFIGHNTLEFDLTFVRQRSWIAGLKPSNDLDLRRYYSHDFVDIMHLWSNWESTPRPSLEGMADVIGLRRKTAKAMKVFEWWSAGDLDSIAVHCREDVRIEQTRLEAKSKEYYRGGWRMLASTPISSMRLSHITTDEAGALRFDHSPANTNRALRTLRRRLGKATEWGLIASPPRIKLLKEEGRSALIDKDAESRLLAAAPQPLRDVAILVLDSGMRPSEVFEMRWEDLTWDPGMIFIPREKPNALDGTFP
jgi:hypothetical protein